MLNRLANLTAARPKRILALTAVFFVVGGVFGGPVAGLLSTGDDFSDPSSESVVAGERIARAAGEQSDPGLVALVRTGAEVGSPEARAQVTGIEREIRREPEVARTLSFYGTKDPGFVSRDRRSTYVLAVFKPDVADDEVAERIQKRLERDRAVTVGGEALSGPAVGEQVSQDLARAELIAFPILFLLSLWVFRGVIAALLPLFVGILTIFATFLGLRIGNEITSLSIYALNLAVALGLGLAIDYSLFVVSRYREEIARSGPGREALVRTMTTAGKTVVFSSLTVAAALASLTVFPQRFLYSMGLSGAICAIAAAVVTLTALPALLAVLGHRVNSLAPKRWRAAGERSASQEREGFWYRLSYFVMRRPASVAVASALVLVVLGLPFLGIKFTGVDASVLPEASSPRQVDNALRRDFPNDNAAPVTVAVQAGPEAKADLRAYASDLRERPGVAAVEPPRRLDDEVWQVNIVADGGVYADPTLDLVRDIRAGPAPAPVEVAGTSAEFVDQQQALGDRLPLALAIMAVTTLLLLFLMTGSVLLPIKALLMNLLTLSAAFGLLVLIFQDGRLEGFLDYTGQGALEATQPLVLFAIAFGLSTDYGVFLLTRIKEARDAGHDDREAVAIGLERTGRIVTAAAVLLCVALGAFGTSEIIFIKQVGIGTALAVLIDATIVRALLVPSLMALLGRANWWAPRPLRRLHDRLGVTEA